MTEKNVRPALDDVTAALERFACATCDGNGRVPEGFQWPDPVCGVCHGARYAANASPREAVEVLRTRGLYPWKPGDAALRWWCEACEGTGERRRIRPGRTSQTGLACECGGRHEADPPTFAALVAVASLGVDTLRNAEALARELVKSEPCIVWRVVTRNVLRKMADEPVYRDGLASIGYVVAHDALGAPNASPFRYGEPEPWPERFPWLGLDGNHVARQSWRIVRDLGLLGALLVALDGHTLTLAVEAI